MKTVDANAFLNMKKQGFCKYICILFIIIFISCLKLSQALQAHVNNETITKIVF